MDLIFKEKIAKQVDCKAFVYDWKMQIFLFDFWIIQADH